MIKKIALLALFLCLGCGTTSKSKVKYGFETNTPDIWDTNPKQSVTIKIEISQ